MCVNFQAKRTILAFLTRICPKMNFGSEFQKCKFQKQTAFTFSAQIYPKKDLRLEIQKTNLRIRISILETLCVLIFKQNGQL